MSKFWISAGELSGDIHGAELIEALLQEDASCEFAGMGGEYMKNAGAKTSFSISELSIMGITEVLGHLPRIFCLLYRIKQAIIDFRPDAIIVIDAPDFHFRVISIAKKLNIPVYYYISPKVWAWRQGRAKFIQRNVQKLISILPFEVGFYRNIGMEIDYVGNPLIDIVNYPEIREISALPGRIGLMPGSRKKEITALMPIFGKTARILKKKIPEISFSCFKAPNIDADFIISMWPKDVPLVIHQPENRWATLRQCEILLAASGTATLESAIAGVPTIVAYRVSGFSAFLGRLLIKVPYISLANLIAEKEIFPEMVQEKCSPELLSQKAMLWLDSENKETLLKEVFLQMDKVRNSLGEPGSAKRAASCILSDMHSE